MWSMIIFWFLLAILVSFTCSVLEAVLLSTPVSFLNMKIRNGSKSAELLLKLKQNIDNPIAAILTLNTCAHTMGAAGVGAEAEKLFGHEYLAIISAILTFLILVLSELIPKSIGAHYWRSLTGISAHLIKWMTFICYPIVIMARKLMSLFAPKTNESTISREEISAMSSIGAEEGVIKSDENKMIQNLMTLKSKKVDDIMTPRTVVTMVEENTKMKDFPIDCNHTRIPVYSGTMDNITGFVMRPDVLKKLASDDFTSPISSIKRNILIFPETLTVPDALKKLMGKRVQIAIIVDEFGSFQGVVTLEDIIETLLGREIVDESDTVDDMQRLAIDKFEKRKLYVEKN